MVKFIAEEFYNALMRTIITIFVVPTVLRKVHYSFENTSFKFNILKCFSVVFVSSKFYSFFWYHGCGFSYIRWVSNVESSWTIAGPSCIGSPKKTTKVLKSFSLVFTSIFKKSWQRYHCMSFADARAHVKENIIVEKFSTLALLLIDLPLKLLKWPSFCLKFLELT